MGKKEENLLILIATLATAEVSAGAVAKADQYKYINIKPSKLINKEADTKWAIQ